MSRLVGFFLLLAMSLLASTTFGALISAPFDNFHIECAQGAGAQRLSVRMVESQGLKRQDTLFVLSCNPIAEVGGIRNPRFNEINVCSSIH